MKNPSRLLTAIPPLLLAGAAAAQGGPMMNNGMWGGASWMGGYGSYLVPVLLVVAVALVAWVVMQKRK